MKTFLCIALTALLAGCAVVQGDASIISESAATVAQKIVIGKTSKSDVERIYGDPTEKTYDSNGVESWSYGSRLADPSNGPQAQKSLLVQFDRSGLAIYYLLTDTDPSHRRQTQVMQ